MILIMGVGKRRIKIGKYNSYVYCGKCGIEYHNIKFWNKETECREIM